MQIESLYEQFLRCGSVCTDSRKAGNGAMFFALKGGNFNGNKFAATALENGCACAVVDEAEYAVDERYILVDDVLESLRALSAYHRSKMPAKIIGITGTNGKTTTKELVSAVLSKKYRTRYTQGNLNNHIGVPLTLLSFTTEDQMGVVEMGANHPCEIKSSVDIACPDLGLITNVGVGHIEGFGSFEGVKKTKAELYDFLRANKRPAFVYSDSADLMEMSEGLQCIYYGSRPDSLVSGSVISMDPYIKVHCSSKSGGFDISTQLIGDYNLPNVLAAVCVGLYFDVPVSDIKAAIEEYSPSNKRSQLVEVGNTRFILDAYNANPTSMAAALENFAKLPAEGKCLILGDMGELGNESPEQHQKITDLVRDLGFESAYFVGENFMRTYDNFVHFSSAEQMNDYLLSSGKSKEWFAGKTILVKGSHSTKTDSIANLIMQNL